MSRSKVTYEWCIQIVDRESQDIDHSEFELKLSTYQQEDLWHAITRIPQFVDSFDRLMLVRYYGNEDDGEQERDYAEVRQAFDVIDGNAIPIEDEWRLPVGFEEGNKVPQRFHKELASAIKRLKPIAMRRRWPIKQR